MARIYRRSDRIEVKIDDVTLKLAPLSLDQKAEVQMAILAGHKSLDIREATRGIALAIQYSVKSVEGLLDSDNNPYQLQFDGDVLKRECVDDLMNLEITSKLALVCSTMVQGIPAKFTDAQNKDLEGVELVKPKDSSEKKN